MDVLNSKSFVTADIMLYFGEFFHRTEHKLDAGKGASFLSSPPPSEPLQVALVDVEEETGEKDWPETSPMKRKRREDGKYRHLKRPPPKKKKPFSPSAGIEDKEAETDRVCLCFYFATEQQSLFRILYVHSGGLLFLKKGPDLFCPSEREERKSDSNKVPDLPFPLFPPPPLPVPPTSTSSHLSASHPPTRERERERERAGKREPGYCLDRALLSRSPPSLPPSRI